MKNALYPNELKMVFGGRSNDNSNDRYLRNMDGTPVSNDHQESGWTTANKLRTGLGIFNLGRTVSFLVLGIL